MIDHARDLLAGNPIKGWKNCLLEKELKAAQRRALNLAERPN